MKQFKFYALVLLGIMLSINQVWAETYTITFKTNSSDGSTTISSSTTVSNVVSDGTANVSGFTNSCSKAYLACVSGVKLGSSSATGTLEFNLADACKSNVKKITVKSAKYGSDTGTLTLYSGSTSLKTGITPGTDYTHTFTTATTVNSIKLATSAKRAYVSKIIIETESTSGGGGSSTGGSNGTITVSATGDIKLITGSSSAANAFWANSTPLTSGGVTLSGSNGSSGSYSYYDGSVVRFYQNNTFTLTPASGVTITQVDIVRSSSSSSNSGTINCTGLTASSSNTTTNTNVYTGSATSAVTFTAAAQARFTAIKVYTSSSSGGPTYTVD